MSDIVLERDDNILKLNDDEEALLNEITVSAEPTLRPRPKPQRPPMAVHPVEMTEDIEAFTNPTKLTAPQRPPPPEVMDHGEDEPMMFEEDDEPAAYTGEQPSEGYNSIDDEKADLLNKLTRLEKKGFHVNKRLNAYSNIEELRTEVKRITYGIEVDQSIRFSRRMLIACVTGLEFVNKRYNPFEIQLDGWSESVMENVDDYDGVFEELHGKYKSKMKVAPEVKLIMMLGGSAMMFHLTNSMFKAALPNMGDVLKQNPDLVKNMVSAVQNTQATQQTAQDPTRRPVQTGDRREMQGPGLDISQLMGGITMPPMPPMNTTPQRVEEVAEPLVEEPPEDDDLSDIVSVSGESTGGEVKEVKVSSKKKRSKKNEISL